MGRIYLLQSQIIFALDVVFVIAATLLGIVANIYNT